MDPIITLAEYKALMGVAVTDTRKDDQIEALLGAASNAVRKYTGRSFEVASGPATERSFQYDGSGVLDIDDAGTVASLTTDGGVPGDTHPVASEQWTAMPQDDSEVTYYLILGVGPYLGASPEMGFERNLDQYPYLQPRAPLVFVTAQWGWVVIPDDVKLATAITVNELVSAGSGGRSEGVTAEGIEGWNRAWGSKGGGGTMALAIPNRARDLLVNYQKINV